MTHSALTSDERDVVQCLFMYGISGLLSTGMSEAQIQAFLVRPAVLSEINALTEEYNYQADFLERQRFMAKRLLARSIPNAIRVLQQALEGVRYMRTPTGEIMRSSDTQAPIVLDEPPSFVAVRAAENVLDRLGVVVDKDAMARGNLDAKAIIVSGPEVTAPAPLLLYAPDETTEEQRALSRERRRTVLDKLVPSLAEYMRKQHAEDQAKRKKHVKDRKSRAKHPRVRKEKVVEVTPEVVPV